jgi:hypothetical protein
LEKVICLQATPPPQSTSEFLHEGQSPSLPDNSPQDFEHHATSTTVTTWLERHCDAINSCTDWEFQPMQVAATKPEVHFLIVVKNGDSTLRPNRPYLRTVKCIAPHPSWHLMFAMKNVAKSKGKLLKPSYAFRLQQNSSFTYVNEKGDEEKYIMRGDEQCCKLNALLQKMDFFVYQKKLESSATYDNQLLQLVGGQNKVTCHQHKFSLAQCKMGSLLCSVDKCSRKQAYRCPHEPVYLEGCQIGVCRTHMQEFLKSSTPHTIQETADGTGTHAWKAFPSVQLSVSKPTADSQHNVQPSSIVRDSNMYQESSSSESPAADEHTNFITRMAALMQKAFQKSLWKQGNQVQEPEKIPHFEEVDEMDQEVEEVPASMAMHFRQQLLADVNFVGDGDDADKAELEEFSATLDAMLEQCAGPELPEVLQDGPPVFGTADEPRTLPGCFILNQ